MTLSSTNISDSFTGTGAETPLDTTFTFYTDDQILVTRRVTSTREETIMLLGTDYTVTGGAGSTGTITPEDGPGDFPITVVWIISRVTPLLQAVDFSEFTSHPSQQLEEIGDRSRMIQQENDVERVADILLNQSVRNFIYNGEMMLNERRSSSYTIDNGYTVDRWRALSGGGDGAFSAFQTGFSPLLSSNSLEIESVGAANKQGIFQVIELDNNFALLASTASLSFEARLRSFGDIVNLRASVITGSFATAALLRADPISAWNAAGTSPTLDGWTYRVPATEDLAPLTDSFQRYVIEGIPITAGPHIAVFIWADNLMPIGDSFNISNVQLEQGDVAHPYQHVSFDEELTRCRRFYERHVFGASNDGLLVALGTAIAADEIRYEWTFAVEKHRAPLQADFDNTPATGGVEWIAIPFALADNITFSTVNSKWGAVISVEFATAPFTVTEQVVFIGGFAQSPFMSVDVEL